MLRCSRTRLSRSLAIDTEFRETGSSLHTDAVKLLWYRSPFVIILAWSFLIAVSLCNASRVLAQVPPCIPSDGELGVRWIVNAGSLHHAASAISLDQQKQYFGTPCTFMVGKLKTEPFAQWNSIGTISIRSAGEVDQCCDEGVGAVMYDPEKWQFTPEEEQRNPGVPRLQDRRHRACTAPAANCGAGSGPGGWRAESFRSIPSGENRGFDGQVRRR